MRLKFFFLFLLLNVTTAAACTFKFGYRYSERLPLIHAEPSNRGLYYDLYTRALNKIGCKLEVVRAPKKRLMKMLELGHIDFYPGFTFTQKRANYTYYINNGLDNSFVAISHIDQKDITSVSELADKVLLIAQGGPTHNAEHFGAILRPIENLSVAEASILLAHKKADFYIYNKPSIAFHLKHNPDPRIKLHPCCGDPLPMYLGFSMASKHISLLKNNNYDPNQVKSKANFPWSLSPTSKAFALQQVLQTMKQSGEIQAIYDSYYH